MLPELMPPQQSAAGLGDVADWLKDCLRLIAKLHNYGEKFDKLDVRMYARAYAGVPRHIAELVTWKIVDTHDKRPTVAEVKRLLQEAMQAQIEASGTPLMLPPPEPPHSGISEETREAVRERLRGLFGKTGVSSVGSPVEAGEPDLTISPEVAARIEEKRRLIRLQAEQLQPSAGHRQDRREQAA